MNSKDNISNEFNDLLSDINKELGNKNNDNEASTSAEIKTDTDNSNTDTVTSDGEVPGTRVFDAVKNPKDLPEEETSKDSVASDSGKSENSEPPSDRTVMPEQNVTTEPSKQMNNSGSTPKKRSKNAKEVPFPQDKKSSGKKNSSSGKRKEKKYGIVGSLLKFILYIAFIAVTSILLAKYIIGVGNDMFAFVKDTYDISEIVYSSQGSDDNTFTISDYELSGNKFTFSYVFGREFTAREENSLDATVNLINSKDNTVTHKYGKFRNEIINGKEIAIDLSDADMGKDEYILRITVSLENNVSLSADISITKKIVDIDIPDGATTEDIAELLKDEGIIDHPFAFKLYTEFKKSRNGGKYDNGYVAGTHRLYSGMDYDTIISVLSPRTSTKTIVKLTFPEGSTVDEIIDILIKGGISNTKEEYIDVINNYDFDYRFVKLLDEKPLPYGRLYRLEGYLFPDTYEFYSNESPESVINRFLANFNSKFDKSFYDEATGMNLTVDEIITIASMIEMEAGMDEDRADISSVFHNRIKSTKNNSAVKYNNLQSDATTDYCSVPFTDSLIFNDTNSTVSFSIDLSKYNLNDANYYFNMNITTGKTRSVALIHINKSTAENGEAVYKISSKTVSNDQKTSSANDLTMSISKANIQGTTLSCEIKLDHKLSKDDFETASKKFNLFRTEYSTYLSQGLMPSAISNPGYDSITAALYPNDTNYYYFVADRTGKSHFTSSNDEHNAKIMELNNSGMAVVIK